MSNTFLVLDLTNESAAYKNILEKIHSVEQQTCIQMTASSGILYYKQFHYLVCGSPPPPPPLHPFGEGGGWRRGEKEGPLYCYPASNPDTLSDTPIPSPCHSFTLLHSPCNSLHLTIPSLCHIHLAIPFTLSFLSLPASHLCHQGLG